jgi:hypothetical protein
MPKLPAAGLLPKLHKEMNAIATGIHELSHESHSASVQCCGLKVALKGLRWGYGKKSSSRHRTPAETLVVQQALANATDIYPDVSLCPFRV